MHAAEGLTVGAGYVVIDGSLDAAALYVRCPAATSATPPTRPRRAPCLTGPPVWTGPWSGRARGPCWRCASSENPQPLVRLEGGHRVPVRLVQLLRVVEQNVGVRT